MLWVPFFEFKIGGGLFVILIGVEDLAIGENATADNGAVLSGFPVAVEKVEPFGYGGGRRSLRRHLLY